MPFMQHLKSRVDFPSKDCITKEDVQQGIETAYPFEHQGFIISGPTAPNVVANPELADFFWSETDGGYIPLGNIYYYNGSSWQLFALIDGSRLANHSVTLVKLSMAGSSAYDIIQVDATGAQLIYIAITDAIQNGTLNPSKLLGPGAGKFVLASTANAYASTTLLTFLQTVIDDNTLPIVKLVRGGANPLGLVLRTKIDGTAIEFAALDLANIGAAGSTGSWTPRRNAGNTGWEYYNASIGTALTLTRLTNSGIFYAIPASSGVLTVPHGLASLPVNTRVVARNITPVDGYLAGDEIEISGLVADLSGDDTESAAFVVCTDATSITVASTTYTQGIVYVPKTGGLTSFDITKWKFNIYLLSA